MYKRTYTFEQRQCEAARIRKKFPLKTPIVIELLDVVFKTNECKIKYLVDSDCTIQGFHNVMKERISISQQEAIFILISKTVIPKYNMLMGEAYELYKDEDGFLYVMICKEHVFGVNMEELLRL